MGVIRVADGLKRLVRKILCAILQQFSWKEIKRHTSYPKYYLQVS
jgi:hypothetical protein